MQGNNSLCDVAYRMQLYAPKIQDIVAQMPCMSHIYIIWYS